MQNYQQLDAEIAQYEAEAKLIKQRAKELRNQRESMAKQERDGAVLEIVTLMLTLGITLDQVRTAFAAAKSVVAPAIHKYWNPETGETHSGKGSCPGWLTPEAKKDARYLNPAWVANDEAKKAAKAAAKNNAESPEAEAANEAPASDDAATVSNAEVPASSGVASESNASALNQLGQSPEAAIV